jgi:DNA-binding transcriptional LysR family regulator
VDIVMLSVNFAPGVSVNLNLIHVFIAVADTLSFKDAAIRVSRSQSAVSAQIKLLEDQLGVQLFNRTTRTVSLTVYGELLLQNTRRGMNELNWGFRRLLETAQGDRGKVVLACSTSIAGTWLPQILKRFEQDFPNIHVVLTELAMLEMVDVILAGGADFGIGPVFPCKNAVNFEPIMDDEFVVLASSSLFDARQKSITLEALARLPLILAKSHNVSRQLLNAAMQERGIRFEAKYECTQQHTLISMVKAGLGATVIPKSIATEFATKTVRAVPIRGAKVVRHIAIITAEGHDLLPAASSLAALVREHVGRAKTWHP